MIRTYVGFDKSEWGMHTTHFEVACNSTIHTSKYFTRCYLIYGFDTRVILVEKLHFSNLSTEEFLGHVQKCGKIAHEHIGKCNLSISIQAIKKCRLRLKLTTKTCFPLRISC